METRLSDYAIRDADRILTPALLIYADRVDANIEATLRMVRGNPDRWRPHIKTAKLTYTVRRMLAYGIRNFKCATSLELLTACREGADDVLVAFAMTGANAERIRDITWQFPKTRISVLIESPEQISAWGKSEVGIFIDVNPGMDRTGIGQGRIDRICDLARETGPSFRGLHYYDGHISGAEPGEREARAHEGYDQLLRIVDKLSSLRMNPGEVITSGTPAAPFGFSFAGFNSGHFVHRISPGTVVYNDFTSLRQLPDFGYSPAALVLSTVISQPTSTRITCDAGHKSVSADAGVPTCEVVGHPGLMPLKPSEEHLPIEISPGARMPRIGDQLYLLPRHVCPTVNNFDEAALVVNGRIDHLESVTARGHESPLAVVGQLTT